jgi:O-antigen/teichoic acid export membrane protein
MSFRRAMKSMIIVGAGQAGTQALSFIKNVIVARLISPEDFGVAASVMIVLWLIELISDLGMDKVLIQAEGGDDPRMQETAHLLMVLRGFACSIGTLALAWPTAWLCGIPHATGAFCVIAVVPVIRGFAHLDIKRFHRGSRFGPFMQVEWVTQLIVAALAWPVARSCGNYSAALWLVIAHSALLTIGSHMVAVRPYGWRWHPRLAHRMVNFGWPLLINGATIFAIIQGERVVIGRVYGMTELGAYAAAGTLTMMPMLAASRMLSTALLPVFSRQQRTPAHLARDYAHWFIVISLGAAVVAVTFVVLGPWMVVKLYGVSYGPAAAIIGWLGVMHALKLMRALPGVVAMSRGDTCNAMFANLWRCAALAPIIVFASAGAGITTILLIGVIGEVAAMCVSTGRLHRVHGVSGLPELRRLCDQARLLFVGMTPEKSGGA